MRPLKLLAHAIERAGQLAELVAIAHVHTVLIVARGNGLGGVGQ